MLNKVYSDFPTFKTVKFHSGLNLILAEKESESSYSHTRNGAGKSSLVEIINALLGSDLRKGNILKSKELLDYRFGIDINLSGNEVSIERTGSTPGKIFIKSMPERLFPVNELDGEKYISNDEWTSLLGENMFDISNSVRAIKSGPSFRSMFSYFARSTKGFETPEKIFSQQSTCSVQVALTYLLKLNWKIARDFEDIRQKDKLIKALKTASNEGTLGDIMGSVPDLRTDLLLKKSKFEKHKVSLSTFRVLPEYQEKEARSAVISKRLAQLSAEDSVDKEWFAQLERALDSESEPDKSKVERLFLEAEVDLPDMVVKRFNEVTIFHESIIRNRKEHLREEMGEISERINKRFEEKKRLDNERSKILSILQSHGALDQYMKLQDEQSQLKAEITLLSKKLEATENLDDKKAELKIERHSLLKKMRVDHTERDTAISNAVVSFADISSELYQESGKFIIDPTDNGPKFEFDISGKKSTGKNKMQIFCFDMTLMKLWANDPKRPDVLIHDSVMFDGVDERQIAKALVLGSEMAKKYNFQYIVTMNSDDMPDMSTYPDFDIDHHRVDLNITDTENGGLFGFRFN
ncbi:ABC-three component system protein [Photobacterium swingsii]|uniref:ABC-three component system protein n=1 Tax=Photobacterium swingsii TaxID=680026 RepID=UPI00352CE207